MEHAYSLPAAFDSSSALFSSVTVTDAAVPTPVAVPQLNGAYPSPAWWSPFHSPPRSQRRMEQRKAPPPNRRNRRGGSERAADTAGARGAAARTRATGGMDRGVAGMGHAAHATRGGAGRRVCGGRDGGGGVARGGPDGAGGGGQDGRGQLRWTVQGQAQRMERAAQVGSCGIGGDGCT